ncbi:high mobility group B protein 15 [Cryptomeria japonica]|uniref:high mobility group B protein 15 n=1 Tax=Cryptomeria japonica TaxID=3369 RepID=UPI0027DA5A59|nr:high mobility group B protein 15 [Cryptomeria japonica]XP_057812686.2 high mobility group B protein 15 [Cryptomeria japonica]XP_057812687.2 high mobility group B protein 15 [Cryptomeria japonica]XP_057812688.2 high mobility group B protein 15 [Cryptomeria japonica]
MSDQPIDINNISQEEQVQNETRLSSQPIPSPSSPKDSHLVPSSSSQQGTIPSDEICAQSVVKHEEAFDGALVPNFLPPQGATPINKIYPQPVLKNEEAVADTKVFLDTLNKFHAAIGTKFMVPTIGGKELDLRLLYLEVTSRGGLKQVIKDRKWKEITAVFNFPSTATNASFVLRKYYISLLHHYEQVYFFGAQGHLIPPPPTALPAPSPVSNSPILNEPANPPLDEVQPLIRKKKRRASTPISGVSPASSVGHPVTGVIDGKFEHGYLVTVVVGSEKLSGVLYQVPTGFSREQFAEVPSYLNIHNNGDAALGVRPRRRRRRKDEIKKRDPDHPKPNRSGYNFFFAEQHTKLKALHPGKDREISKMIGDSWNNLNEEEKSVYQELGLKDKERYRSEMQEYKEKQKLQSHDTEVSIAGNEGIIQQLGNQHGLQFECQGTSITTIEGMNLHLANHSSLCEHQPDNHESVTETTGFKMADLPDMSDTINTIVPKKLESLVGSTVLADQQCSVDTTMSIKEESCIQEDKCKQLVSEQ